MSATETVAVETNGGEPTASPEQPVKRAAKRASTGDRRCFVISPIGDEHSEVREHANDVFDFIIKPAMKKLGVKAMRSDHLHEPGLISEQMLRAILEYDLCVAVLTFHNPNVFYELAVAQAAGRPVVILLEKGSPIPFDIKDLRCVYYDLKPRPLFDRVYANELARHVSWLADSGWPGSSIPGLPTIADGSAGCTVLPSANDFGTSSDWLELLTQSSQRFDIAGINLHDWRKTRGFRETVIRKASDGCRVRALVMDPDNPALPGMINDQAATSSLDEVLIGLRETSSFFARLAAENDRIEMRSIRRGFPHANLTVTEALAVAIPYLYSGRTAASPLMRCEVGGPLYATFSQEFESLWGAAESPA